MAQICKVAFCDCYQSSSSWQRQQVSEMVSIPRRYSRFCCWDDVVYLLEPDNVWMQQGAVVDKLPLNIFINLQEQHKVNLGQGVFSALCPVSNEATCVSFRNLGKTHASMPAPSGSRQRMQVRKEKHARVS